jgi:predicted TIM-barrel fold metal-dependent hydrolase
MIELPIYNCHIHTFTTRNVPPDLLKVYAGPFWGTLGSWFIRLPFMKRFFVHMAHGAYRFIRNDNVQRLAAMYSTGNDGSQKAVLEEIKKQYPKDTTRFVVLPMNLEHIGLSALEEHIAQQHEHLLKLAQSDPCVIPFFAVDPREPNIVDQARENLGPGKFRGVKIYPNLGYYPYDKNTETHTERLREVYKICVQQNVPVMTHCSTGGMYKYGYELADRVRVGHPDNYKSLMDEFKDLRLCLAHFGGSEEWDKQLLTPFKVKPGRKEPTWVHSITEMICSGDYPNLYTDISYLIFQLRPAQLHVDYVDYLKVLLVNSRLRERVLFGSDFYAVKREAMSEKEVGVNLRSRLGEELYFRIAHHNPRRYLGLPPD